MSQQPGPPTMGAPRPRPGAGAPPGAPAFQQQTRFVDYGVPKAYDTSVRPAAGITRARHAPAQLHRPQQAMPESAWATQTRRVAAVQHEKRIVPFTPLVGWIAAAVMGLGLIAVLGYFFIDAILRSSDNVIWWPVAAFFALMSLLVIIAVVVLADRWDPQPIGLVIVAVCWGGAVAAFSSYLLNTGFSLIVYAVTGSPEATNLIGPVIGAPFFEESTKGLGLLALLFLARRYFNGPLDGAIYGMLIGGGFAFTENILYYNHAVEDAGVGGLLVLGFIRGVLGIFGHAIYTGLTGIVIGFVVRKWGTFPAALSFLIAPVAGMLLHGTWNLGASVGTSLIFALILFLLQGVVDVIFLAILGALMWDEARLTRVRLGDYANHGWLTHEEVNMLATWRGRREGKHWADSFGQKKLMKQFIREAADLASVRQRLLADGQAPKAVALERALLDRLTANRRALLQYTR